MELKDSKTKTNLMRAFSGESQVNNRILLRKLYVELSQKQV